MAGRPYGYLYCGDWVRHGSEQPYRKLLMLKGLTGLRMQLGNHMMKRTPTPRFFTSANVVFNCLRDPYMCLPRSEKRWH